MNEYEFKRKELVLSRKEVCEHIGIPYVTLQAWELGVNNPTPWVWNLVYAEMKRLSKKKYEK